MAWSGLPPGSGDARAPVEFAILRDGDSLGSLAREAGLTPGQLGELNGVTGGARVGTCAWGNDIGDLAMGVGGVIVGGGSARDRSKCGRDTAFRAGSIIKLPVGMRLRAPGQPGKGAPPTKVKKSRAGLVVGVLAIAGALLASMSSAPVKAS